jgi:hypothetical protein
MITPSRPLAMVRAALGAVLAIGLLAAQAACSPPTPPPATPDTPGGPATHATSPVDPTASWTAYHDASIHLSLRYPPAWQQRTCAGAAHTSLFLAPSAAALGVCGSDFGGQMSVVAFDGDQRAALHLTGSHPISGTASAGGVDGTRESVTADASDSGLGPAAGTILVAYVFYTGGLTYRFGYTQAPSGATATDVQADFNTIVERTVTFG